MTRSMNPDGRMSTNTSAERTNIVKVLVIVSFMFFPSFTTFNLIKLGLTLLLFFYDGLTHGFKIEVKSFKLMMLMLASLILPLVTVFLFEWSVDANAWIHEFQRLLFYAALLFVVEKCKISFRFLYWICIAVLLFNTVIQVLQWNGVEEVNDFIRDYYLEPGASTTHLDLATTAHGRGSFRSGSIFANPNVYMVIPLAVLILILQADMVKRSLMNYCFALVALYSLFLTGSRTVLVVATALLAVYIFKFSDRYGKLIFVTAILAFVFFFGRDLFDEFRMFDLSSGMTESFNTKITMLRAYLTHANPIYFLTGSLSGALAIHMDSEIGYLFSYFGVLGIIWYIRLVRMMRKNYAQLPFMTVGIIITMVLVGTSATVVLCMPIFPFVCLISFSNILEGEKSYEIYRFYRS